MPRVLVVYDTTWGLTGKIAAALADEIGADIERIVEKKDKSGLLGALKPGKQLFVGQMVELAPPQKDPSQYDLVVIASPVRFNSMSLPVRAYITRFRDRLKSVAVLVTGGVSTSSTIKDISYLCGKQPVAKAGITHASYYSGLYKKKYLDFVKKIKGE